MAVMLDADRFSKTLKGSEPEKLISSQSHVYAEATVTQDIKIWSTSIHVELLKLGSGSGLQKCEDGYGERIHKGLPFSMH